MKVVFYRGSSGSMICRNTPDGGAWIVPGNREKHHARPKKQHVLEVEITGETRNGKLRFARVMEDVTQRQESDLESFKDKILKVETFEQIRDIRCGDLSLYEGKFSTRMCVAEDGTLSATSIELAGWWEIETDGRAKSGTRFLNLEKPIPFSPSFARYTSKLAVVIVEEAVGYRSRSAPEYVNPLLEDLSEITRLQREIDDRCGKNMFKRHRLAHAQKKDRRYYIELVAYELLEDLFDGCNAHRLDRETMKAIIPITTEVRNELSAELERRKKKLPEHVSFTDGKERPIRWCGQRGTVYVEKREFFDDSIQLEVSLSDPRVARIQDSKATLCLETQWNVYYDTEGQIGSHYGDYGGVERKSRKLI